MVNRKIGLGILVMVLVFGMTVVGNIEAQTDNGGEFILIDIPAKYNGKYAILLGASSVENQTLSLFGCDGSLERLKKSFPIIDGKVIIPFWVATRDNKGEGKLERYSGNDTLAIVIDIIEKEDVNSKVLETVMFNRSNKKLFSPITSERIIFSNGSATGSYNNKSTWVKR